MRIAHDAVVEHLHCIIVLHPTTQMVTIVAMDRVSVDPNQPTIRLMFDLILQVLCAIQVVRDARSLNIIIIIIRVRLRFRI